MGKIFLILGKSSTGKDTVFNKLLENKKLNLSTYVSYTTRPMRDGECEGREYHFCTNEKYEEYRKNGKIIEERCYNTIMGLWHYFTVDDGSFDNEKDVLMIGTVESFLSIRDFWGGDKVCPIFIDCDDRTRLFRAISREEKRKEPQYKEMCRRFVADSDDFSDERIKAAGINKRFINNDLDECVSEIASYIKQS